MEQYQTTLQKLVHNANTLRMEKVRRILVLHEEKIDYLGDFCLRFNKMLQFRSMLNNAAVTINFAVESNRNFYEGILTNNPNIDQVTTLPWQDIPFDSFDIIFCVTLQEEKLLAWLHEQYGERIHRDQCTMAVFAIPERFLEPAKNLPSIFPIHAPLIDRIVHDPKPGELYLSKAEQEWGDRWLESMGVKANEKLVIILDSTSRKSKLLNIYVHFEFLSFIAAQEHTRVLVFDEKNKGKEAFYSAWLGPVCEEKLIFSKGLSLRQDLCLIGSSYTKLIIGPCTGLMHCASSIYNNYIVNGKDPREVPLMITYTGEYPEGDNANNWWGKSPLVNCLLLKKKEDQVQPVLLSELSETEKTEKYEPCNAYTAPMLIRIVKEKWSNMSLTA